MYGQKKTLNVTNGSWNMRDIKFNTPGQLKKWSYIAIQDRPINNFAATATATVQDFRKAFISNGVGMTNEAFLAGRVCNMQYPTDPSLEEMIKGAATHNISLLLIILPGEQKTDSFNQTVYSHIKTLGDIKYGIHTICVIGNKFFKGDPQYFGNVALKLNLKLGGNNQYVEPARLSFISEDKTMIVGMDVTHPSPGSRDNAPSVAGMVASTDKNLGQWPGTLRTQRSRQEEVSDLKVMLMTHLDHWIKIGKHSQLPENILVYRDGVSEGQYDMVLTKEVQQLREACKAKYTPAQVRLSPYRHVHLASQGCPIS